MELVARVQICLGSNHSPTIISSMTVIKIPKVVNLGRIKGRFGSPFWRSGMDCVVQGRPSLVRQALVEWEICKQPLGSESFLCPHLDEPWTVLEDTETSFWNPSLPWRSQESHTCTHTTPRRGRTYRSLPAVRNPIFCGVTPSYVPMLL